MEQESDLISSQVIEENQDQEEKEDQDQEEQEQEEVILKKTKKRKASTPGEFKKSIKLRKIVEDNYTDNDGDEDEREKKKTIKIVDTVDPFEISEEVTIAYCAFCFSKVKSIAQLKKCLDSHVNVGAIFVCYSAKCNLKFNTEEKRKEHFASAHSGSKAVLKCHQSTCSFKAASRDEMQDHVAKTHPITLRLFCDVCKYDKIFSSYAELLEHNKTNHGQIIVATFPETTHEVLVNHLQDNSALIGFTTSHLKSLPKSIKPKSEDTIHCKTCNQTFVRKKCANSHKCLKK